MQALILAGGKGSRLHPLTTSIPKPMVPLFDRPVMEHCIRLLARHGINDVIVTLSAESDDIPRYFGDGSRWGVRIRYCVENEPLGTAGAIKLAQDMIADTFFVVSGDVVTDADLAAALHSHKSASAIATLLLYEVDDPSDFGLVGCDEGGRVTRFLEKPGSADVFTNTVSTGIYIFEREILSCIPSSNRACDLALHLFPSMLSNSEPVYGFALPGYWCDIGNLVHYRKLHFDALKGKLRLDLPAFRVTENIWLGPGVDVHTSAQISGPLFLGGGVCVRRDVTLGGHTVIGADSLVDEEAYVARSVMGGKSFIGRRAWVTGCTVASGYTVDEGVSVLDRTLAPQSGHQRETRPQEAAQTLSGTIEEDEAYRRAA